MMRAGLAFARAASHPIMSGVRDFCIAAEFVNSEQDRNYHFTLAFGPAPAPGWRRLSSPVFSPGTGSPPAVLLVEAQPTSPQIANTSRANIERYFIRPNVGRAKRFSTKIVCLRRIAGNNQRRNFRRGQEHKDRSASHRNGS